MTELDSIDKKIIEALIEDGRASVEKVAEIVGLSPTPARRRIRRLESDGVIKGYSALIDVEKCGLELALHVLITLTVGDEEIMTNFEAAVKRLPEIQRCDLIAGENCYILSMKVRNMRHYNDYLRKTIVNLPGVYEVQTKFVIGNVKDTMHLALG